MDNYQLDELNAAEKAGREAANDIRLKRDIEDIKHVMGSEQGRRVMWELLSQGKIFVAIMPGDPQVMAFQEGQRNISLAWFQRVMAHCPEQYLKMAAEANEEQS